MKTTIELTNEKLEVELLETFDNALVIRSKEIKTLGPEDELDFYSSISCEFGREKFKASGRKFNGFDDTYVLVKL